MARTFLTRELGLEHLPQKEKMAVSSAKYRVYSLFLTKDTKHISYKERVRVVAFFIACDICRENLLGWSDSFSKAKELARITDKRDIERNFLVFSREIRKKIKSDNSGLAKHRKSLKIN